MAISMLILDSRIGLIRGEEYHQLTSDHSLVNELLKAGQLTPEEAEAFMQKNIITPSLLGKKMKFSLILGQFLESGDYLLLNSDGLTNMISGSERFVIVTSDIPLAEIKRTLVFFLLIVQELDTITRLPLSMRTRRMQRYQSARFLPDAIGLSNRLVEEAWRMST